MDKTAELSGMRFGIEIETVGITRKDTVLAILGVVGGEVRHESGSYDEWRCTASDSRQWKAVSDASIGRGNAEVVSPILSYPDDMPVLQNVIRAIRKSGGKVNSSCGIHVHVDASYWHERKPACIVIEVVLSFFMKLRGTRTIDAATLYERRKQAILLY